ncbi:hypothetical protein JCM10207_002571 [Rhodosporidiobolus poonsookiae]
MLRFLDGRFRFGDDDLLPWLDGLFPLATKQLSELHDAAPRNDSIVQAYCKILRESWAVLDRKQRRLDPPTFDEVKRAMALDLEVVFVELKRTETRVW